MNGELEIGKVQMQDDGTNLIVTIELLNKTDRTLHAYADPRGILYDPATRTLTVMLTDRDLQDRVGSTFRRPNLRAIDPQGITLLRLTLPRVLNRMKPSAEKLTSPEFEKLNIFEAQTVEVRVAWSDRPFYADPRPRKTQRTPRQELVAWEKGVAVGRGGPKSGPTAQ